MFTICCLETHMDYLVDVHTLFSNIFFSKQTLLYVVGVPTPIRFDTSFRMVLA